MHNLPLTNIVIFVLQNEYDCLIKALIESMKRHEYNFKDFLKHLLDKYVAKLPVKTLVLTQTIREGLVAALLLGAKHSNGSQLELNDVKVTILH